MSDIDLSTGLPALPAGFTWNVRIDWSEYDFSPNIHVALREQKKFLFFRWKRTTDSSSLDTTLDKDNPTVPSTSIDPSEYAGLILPIAHDVLKRQEKRFANESFRARFEKEAERLSGDYPPKSLPVE